MSIAPIAPCWSVILYPDWERLRPVPRIPKADKRREGDHPTGAPLAACPPTRKGLTREEQAYYRRQIEGRFRTDSRSLTPLHALIRFSMEKGVPLKGLFEVIEANPTGTPAARLNQATAYALLWDLKESRPAFQKLKGGSLLRTKGFRDPTHFEATVMELLRVWRIKPDQLSADLTPGPLIVRYDIHYDYFRNQYRLPQGPAIVDITSPFARFSLIKALYQAFQDYKVGGTSYLNDLLEADLIAAAAEVTRYGSQDKDEMKAFVDRFQREENSGPEQGLLSTLKLENMPFDPGLKKLFDGYEFAPHRDSLWAAFYALSSGTAEQVDLARERGRGRLLAYEGLVAIHERVHWFLKSPVLESAREKIEKKDYASLTAELKDLQTMWGEASPHVERKPLERKPPTNDLLTTGRYQLASMKLLMVAAPHNYLIDKMEAAGVDRALIPSRLDLKTAVDRVRQFLFDHPYTADPQLIFSFTNGIQ